MRLEALILLHDSLIGSHAAVFYNQRLQTLDFPPVEIEEFRTLTTLEGKIEVVGSLGFLCKINSQRLPFLPTSGSRHIQRGKELTTETVDTYLYPTAAQATGHTGNELFRHISVELDVLQLDIVAIVDIADIYTNLVILFGLHTLRECHRLSLHLLIWIEGRNGFHALVGRQNRGEAAVSIVLEFLYGHATSKTATIGQFTCVIEEIGMSLIVGHATVVCKRPGVAQRHNLAGICPRACGR